MGNNRISTKKTYAIRDDGTHPRAITCLLCGLTSHHGGDVANRYCAKCGIFHEDVAGRNYQFDCVECGRHIFYAGRRRRAAPLVIRTRLVA